MNEAVCGPWAAASTATNATCRPAVRPRRSALVTRVWAASSSSMPSCTSGTPRTTVTDKTAIKRLANSLAATKVMYMLANQVPLLDAAGSVAMDRALVTQPPSAPARMRTTAGDVFGLLSRARREALPRDRAHDRGRVFRSQRSPELPDHSGPSCRGPEGIPRHQRSGIERHHLLRLSGTSRHGTLRLSLESHVSSACWREGYQAGKPLPSVSGMRAGTCPDYIWIEGSRPESDRQSG